MALKFIDSFELYASTAEMILGRWTSSALCSIVATPRNGANALKLGNGAATGTCYLDFANHATWVVGFGLYAQSLQDNSTILEICDLGTEQVDIRTMSNGSVKITRNGTMLAQSAIGALTLNVWYWVEFKVTVDNAAGAVELRINGVNVASAAGVDTQNTANAYANRIGFTSTGLNPNPYIDDLYICDGSGAIRNDFLGDCKVMPSHPNGAGDLADWAPSAGANWENVDDATPDGDATYNSSATPGDVDAYALEDVVLTGDCLGVQLDVYARKDDAGGRVVRGLLRIAAANHVAADKSLADTYRHYAAVWEQNPDSGLDFSQADLNALQAGMEMVS